MGVDGNALKSVHFTDKLCWICFSERLKFWILHVNTDLSLNVIGKYEKSRFFCEFSHLLFVLWFGRRFIINYLLAKNYKKKIDLNPPSLLSMTYFRMIRAKHWHCSKLNQALLYRIGLPSNTTSPLA